MYKHAKVGIFFLTNKNFFYSFKKRNFAPSNKQQHHADKIHQTE